MRIVIIDVTASADPAMIRRAVLHASAFETADTPLYIVEGEGLFEEANVLRLKHKPTLQTNERGGVASLLRRMLFEDETLVPVVYAISPGVDDDVAKALGIRRAEIRCAVPQQWNAAYDGDDCGWTARPLPGQDMWSGLDVGVLTELLTHDARQGREHIAHFRERLAIDAEDALEHADRAMEAQCAIDASQSAIDLLHQIGDPRIAADPFTGGDAVDVVRSAFENAVADARTTSSSPSCNLMDQARVQAWFKVDRLFGQAWRPAA